MIKAKGTIIVGKKEYQKGQTVCGLSRSDIAWMREHGFIEEVKEPKKAVKKEGANHDISGDAQIGS